MVGKRLYCWFTVSQPVSERFCNNRLLLGSLGVPPLYGVVAAEACIIYGIQGWQWTSRTKAAENRAFDSARAISVPLPPLEDFSKGLLMICKECSGLTKQSSGEQHPLASARANGCGGT